MAGRPSASQARCKAIRAWPHSSAVIPRSSQVPASVAICDFDGASSWEGVREVAIGPEGGWDEGEWPETQPRLSLGPTVLRAETAAVMAAGLLAFTNGSWGFTAGGPQSA